jgi:hypothetical protein
MTPSPSNLRYRIFTPWRDGTRQCPSKKYSPNSRQRMASPPQWRYTTTTSCLEAPWPPMMRPSCYFYRIEQCQEIATLAGDPYTQIQIINSVVCILMQAQVLPSKEFDTWEQTPNKMYPGLKTFIHEAYTRCLQSLALRTMTGQQGYAPGGGTNMFNVLESKDEDTDTADDATTTTATQTAAFTMTSTLGTTYGGATTISSKISLAITQLAANQLAIQQQIAAMTLAANAPAHHTQFHIPPIRNMGQQPFAGAAQGMFNTRHGRGGCQGGGRGCGCSSSRGGGCGRGAFAHQFPGVVGGIPPFVNGPPAAVVPPTGTWVNAPFQSNTTKRYANWNICWSCGFDVEDGHTSATCPTHWHKTNHQVGFTWGNAQQWINQGYLPCTKGMHKIRLPKQPWKF